MNTAPVWGGVPRLLSSWRRASVTFLRIMESASESVTFTLRAMARHIMHMPDKIRTLKAGFVQTELRTQFSEQKALISIH